MHPLVKLRLERGMTRADLADSSNISWGTIRRIEIDNGVAGEDTVIKLAKALGISAVDLAGLIGPEHSRAAAA